MINLQVQISGADDLKSQLSGLRDQLPYATSVAINHTLDDIQGAVRQHVHSTFIMRSQDFIDRSIYIGPRDRARKDSLEGTVRINPDRDFLAKFEDGGEKTPLRSTTLAIPIVRMDSPGMIIRRGDPLSIKNLMAALNKKGDAQGRLKRRKGSMDVQQAVRLVKTAKGTFIVQGAPGAGAKVLYAFKPSVPLTASLSFADIAMATAVDRWSPNAEEAIQYAIETMR